MNGIIKKNKILSEESEYTNISIFIEFTRRWFNKHANTLSYLFYQNRHLFTSNESLKLEIIYYFSIISFMDNFETKMYQFSVLNVLGRLLVLWIVSFAIFTSCSTCSRNLIYVKITSLRAWPTWLWIEMIVRGSFQVFTEIPIIT